MEPESPPLVPSRSTALLGDYRERPEEADFQTEVTSSPSKASVASGASNVLWSRHRFFTTGVALLIFANTILIGVEAAFIQYGNLVGKFEFAVCVFTALYVVEVAIRMYDQGLNYFSCTETAWNHFDFWITAISLADAVMVIANIRASNGGEAACRLFRILRILRMFRAVRFLGDIEYVIMLAGKATLKLCFLVFVVLFVAGVIITHLVFDSTNVHVRDDFGDLGSSMWSLLKVMTVGEEEAMNRVVVEKPQMVFFFVAFIFCAAIALLSLVPAIFIALNLEARSQEQRERDVHNLKMAGGRQRRYVERMYHIARQSNPMQEPGVSWADMEATLEACALAGDTYGEPRDHEELRSYLAIFFSEQQLKSAQTAPVRVICSELLAGFEAVQSASMVRLWESINEQRMQITAFLKELSIARAAEPPKVPSTVHLGLRLLVPPEPSQFPQALEGLIGEPLECPGPPPATARGAHELSEQLERCVRSLESLLNSARRQEVPSHTAASDPSNAWSLPREPEGPRSTGRRHRQARALSEPPLGGPAISECPFPAGLGQSGRDRQRPVTSRTRSLNPQAEVEKVPVFGALDVVKSHDPVSAS